MMTQRRMFATTTDASTAMSETALCEEHNTPENQALARGRVQNRDGSDLMFRDVTGNDAVSCIVCGYADWYPFARP